MENKCICCNIEIPENESLCKKCLQNSQTCTTFCELILAFQEGRLIVLPKEQKQY